MSVKLLALAASTRPESLNKKLLAIAVAHAQKAGAEVTVYDYATCETPIYRDDASQPYPASAKALGEALRAHDGLLLASPEYNWSMPGSLKNLIDWLSVERPMSLKGKHALLMCASPSVRGGILGLNQLSVPLNHLGVYVYPHLIAVGDAESQITANGIAGAKDAGFLAECVADFVRVSHSAKR